MAKKNKSGFTLVEAVMCIVIGTLILAAVADGLKAGSYLGGNNRYYIYGTDALMEELENVRNMNYDTFVALGGSSTFTNTQLAKLPGGSGSRTIANSFGSDIKKLTLNVSWDSRNGKTMNQSLTTYITRKGLNGS